MGDYRCAELLTIGNRLFAQKTSLDSLWQEIAENFYVERATFTATRSLGDEFADNLTSSYPLQARRDLANILGTMLRPRDKTWFKMSAGDPKDLEAKAWLEWAGQLQRNAMYDRQAGFVRATKEGDNDYATFGQCVISTEMNWHDEALLYRCHHLRDVAWSEGMTGQIDRTDVKWKAKIVDVIRKFGEDKVHPKMLAEYKRGGEFAAREVECRHVVVPSHNYESNYKDSRTGKSKRYKQPWVSVYLDLENEHVLEETGSWTQIYTIPRWQTVSDSQYSYSPAVVATLPSARLFQALALTILQAGEKYTDPPMLAVGEAIRSDINLFAGGITYVSEEYDERLGDVLRPISQDKSGMGIGFDIQEMVRREIHEGFFLNRINLPNRGSAEMTAFETAQRVQEYIREALPIFEPIEHEYNGSLCEITFETLLRANAFGDPRNIPEQLQGQSVEFKFESPLHAAEERLKGQKFMGAIGLISQAAGLDPSVTNVMDIKEGLRDAVIGSEVPASWVRPEQEVAEMEQQQAEAQEMQQTMQMLGQGAEVAKTAGEAAGALGLMDEGGEIA